MRDRGLIFSSRKINERIHFDKRGYTKQAPGDGIDPSSTRSPTPQPNDEMVEQQGTLSIPEQIQRPQ